MKILNAQLGKTAFVASDAFSMGDIPVGLIAYRYRRLVPDWSGLDHLTRWYDGLEQRAAFKQHILPVPFV
jgi:glutathione S-transferase